MKICVPTGRAKKASGKSENDSSIAQKRGSSGNISTGKTSTEAMA